MREPTHADRRTVLKTMTLTALGGAVVPGSATASRERTSTVTTDAGNVLEVVAEHDHDANEHVLNLGTDQVPAGWTTVEFANQTNHTHIAYLGRLPQAALDAAEEADEDILDYYVEHVTRPFQWFMDDLDPSKEPDPADLSDEYTTEEAIFPPWFGDVVPSGGAGFTTGGRTSRTTVELEPGEYIVECYVKDGDGTFHSYLGMIEHVTVTDDRVGREFAPTLDVSVSTDGIDVGGDATAGQHTVAVHFEDQQIYEHLLGHDLHLVRLDDGTTVDDVNDWMNWMAPHGLVSDGSEPSTFVGGVQTIATPELLEGSGTETAYLHVDLAPGDYAWVSEVPDPAGNGLLEEFSVESVYDGNLAGQIADHGHYSAFPLGPEHWFRQQEPYDVSTSDSRWLARPTDGGAVRCLVRDVEIEEPPGRNAGFDLHLGPLGSIGEVVVESETVTTQHGANATLGVALYLDVDDDGEFFEWQAQDGTTETFAGLGDDDEGIISFDAGGAHAITDDTEFPMVGAQETVTLGELKAGAIDGIDRHTFAALYVGVVDTGGGGVEEIVVRDVHVLSPDQPAGVNPLTDHGTPGADPGRSRNFGNAGEHPDDDLTERAANSNMSDEMKAMFDRFANLDVEDLR